MPELAEVEFYRQQWNPGLDQRVRRIHLHARKRIFRGLVPAELENLSGRRLLRSLRHGKQMLFEFAGPCWLGIHLGMTGSLRAERLPFQPGKHDHLVLFTSKHALVFRDPRQFGRVRFSESSGPPDWWDGLPPAIDSSLFTLEKMSLFLQRHRKLPVKATLLLQTGFPGVGNWMADEILWRARLHPRRRSGELEEDELQRLWKTVRFVCRAAIKHIGPGFADPPAGWLIHERWTNYGRCPRHRAPLQKEVIGGRATAWCPRCQPKLVDQD